MNILNQQRKILRRIRMFFYRKRITNSNFSIISNNCISGMLYNDLNARFNSPTINLFIEAKDYVSFLQNLKENLKKEIKDVTNGNEYPIGLLDNSIRIHFLHYKTFEQAINQWKTRKQRINFDNLYIIFIERDGCTHDLLKQFDELPYKNKIAIVHKKYKDIKCSYVIPGYENENQVGIITQFNGILGKRFYDQVDWAKFLNTK